MSGGASGLQGYVYQQRYLTFRVLASVAGTLLDAQQLVSPIRAFSVEGRGSPAAPVWDVRFVLTDDAVHLRECKDTEITREDRKVFYQRVRKELHAGTPAGRLTIGWVTDPDKQGRILDHFAGVIPLSQSPALAIPQQRPEEVRSPDSALEEALYFLCSPSTDSTPPCPIEDARNILRRLTIDRHYMADLVESVELLATGVFTTGTGAAIATFITGELSQRICDVGHASYSLDEFLNAVQVGSVALHAPEILGRLLTFYSAAGYAAPPIRGIRWARLPEEPTKVWALADRLPGFTGTSCLISAPTGVGKTVTSEQSFIQESGRRNPYHVLRVESQLLSVEEVDGLLQLVCILSGLAPTWLVLDGVDEVRLDRSDEWMRIVDRLLRIPNLTRLLTVRQEVLSAHPWLQRIAAALPPQELLPLTKEQIQAEFQRVGLPVPANPALLRALQNPLLLSLYAGVVTPEDMPLADSGEVTAFQVIEAFWQRTITVQSIGQRAVGNPERSLTLKRRAAADLVRRTLRGDLAVRLDDCSADAEDGVEMLRREGVVLRQGSHAVRWVHDWVCEYALIDYIVAEIQTPTVRDLLQAIEAVTVDHVARTAAAAGLKWVIAHPEWGTAQEYLLELRERRRGHASDVLAVLVEEDARRLTLATLPVPLLIEVIHQARVLRARQWREQIADLPLALFVGDDGERLQAVTTQYEVEMGL